MNTAPDDFESTLVASFRREHQIVPEQPFIGRTIRRIARARRRRSYVNYALQAAGVAALILGSRPLIEASAIVSAKLDAWFAVGIEWLATPLGTVSVLAGILCVAVPAWRCKWH